MSLDDTITGDEGEDGGLPTEQEISLDDELGRSFAEYGLSVIVSRALPDVRDGMKPVHRRIVHAMNLNGYKANGPYKKSARIVGDVMGQFHPHGDSAIYDTMVRMAQPWAMRQLLVDGQGNFGSVDGDSPAAMRYTEARMTRASHDLVADIDKNTVDFVDNYDGSQKEPAVLPTKLPNLIINGGHGIAVGMATSIPPHNPGEVLEACQAMLDDPDISVDDLMEIMPGPDFPTGGVIQGQAGVRRAYMTGDGKARVSAVYEIKEGKNGRSAIEVTELPYGVNKANLISDIAGLVKQEKVKGIADVLDMSDRKGLCVRVDVRKDSDPHVVANALCKQTQLVKTVSVNATCLDPRGRPKVMSLTEMLGHFVDHRRDVVRRRTIHELNQARDRLHLVVGLYAAVSRIDDVVSIIRHASDREQAHARLMAETFEVDEAFAELIAKADPDSEVGDTFQLSQTQAKAILEMRLNQLTGLERERIAEEAREKAATVTACLEILNDRSVLDGVLAREFAEMKEAYSEPRRTEVQAADPEDMDEEDFIERRDVVITLTREGYVKWTNLDAYRAQKRGGKGRSGMDTKDGDVVITTLVATTHTPILFFTTKGKAHSLKAWRLPEKPVNARGRPIVNSLALEEDEHISSMLAMPEDSAELDGKYLMFVTDFGTVRRNEAKEFANIRSNGKIAIKLEGDDGELQGSLVRVLLCDGSDDLLMATRKGIAIRFAVEDVRVFKSRDSVGVRGVRLGRNDSIVDACVLPGTDADANERTAYLNGGSCTVRSGEGESEGETFELSQERMAELRAQERFVFGMSALGFGKLTSSHAYRKTSRGGKGITGMKINGSTGDLVASFPAEKKDELVVVTDSGQTIRTALSGMRVMARDTRGYKLIDLAHGQQIVAATPTDKD